MRSLAGPCLLLTLAACAPAPQAPPAPLSARYATIAAARHGWEFPDTIPDTTVRRLVAGDATHDGIPDLALLVTHGDTGTIYFLPGAGYGLYRAPVEVATTSPLDDDVLFILNGDLAFGKRASDDFIAWHWDRRHRRMKLIPDTAGH